MEDLAEEIQRDEVKIPYRSLLKMASSGDESEKVKKKSDLWLEESGCKIMYTIYQKEEEMLFTYKINKLKVE